ncbi:hypothetical protein M3M28_03825 [Gulosibacter sp. ACHW.36C]|uniref:Transposase n=1 Tax=Gulosibacter sediminis TaxID=1729695 RepID=A0ABY4MZV6_9MICO|nr:hypothetical protein [Gulosibacter sediminis]UQN15597.1 hypothetical protein M3M28_03825 [Gulosibacter sediminis]
MYNARRLHASLGTVSPDAFEPAYSAALRRAPLPRIAAAQISGRFVLNWLDDHDRYLLSCTVHTSVTGDDVVPSFLANIERHGPPASTLTDNGRVYTTHHGGGRNAFEYVLAIADDTTVTVTHLTTGEVLSTHDIDPDRGYWRNKQREPGRWPGSR